jgi:methylated-DNA-[protein]-cysteine S-methyltransferase
MVLVDTVESPVGPLTVSVRAERLCLLHFGGDGATIDQTLERWYPGEARDRRPATTIRDVLSRYFAGDFEAIERVAVELNGTPFQTRVWNALRRIPAGTTISYGELARRVGEPAAVRAVGAANGANPIAVVVPCHRVIGANGTLTGYGGGLDRKRWLLTHERVEAPTLFA